MIVITFIIYNLVRLSSTRSGSGRPLSEKGTRSDDRTRLEHGKEPSGYKLERRQTSFNCNDRIP